ncbi:hypothetical protein [Methylobacterium sp. Leaf100]|uniref:hypothetical protein n=1 Tax=Methylobacterium sp. Leaf100 TaxID=1736252 RepID=UPI0006FF3F6F|nr:hypothetical protein [Methylobacterium sp. Leaf100]KQP35967.1 hypothetical protein ASF25_13435 [Methylobacterium sp. Leaf100]
MKIPGPVEINTAWRDLPVYLRDHIGFIAFDMVFQGFLSGQAYALEDRVLASDDDRGEAYDRECKRLVELYRAVEDAVPDLFGPEGENPDWAESTASPFHPRSDGRAQALGGAS